ncbi:Flp family type IVb pilin [Sphingomicrobium sediminis]|uniref:Flp family type IVb pilin n=1 Tax=Sphingomicrobium sediminis TaxID=2950949 RepID=A0A9X2J576_9SPHN|nr:Flp family type IVb pilin [Sphingomicrobium sediminis]MCM8557967.1 Flp family type IVb pilin [Sphingomicrobium sediminis]
MTNFVKMIKDESGASAAEYALILAIIGATVAIASIVLGNAIGGAMNDASNCLNATANQRNAACI